MSDRKWRPVKFPWMPFFGDDFFNDLRVLVMTGAQQLLYLKLLWRSWREGPLPAEPAQLRNLLGLTAAEFGEFWALASPCFEAIKDGRFTSPRLEEHYREQLQRYRKNAGRTAKATAAAADARRQRTDTVTDDVTDTVAEDVTTPATFDRGQNTEGFPPYPPKGKGGEHPTASNRGGVGEGTGGGVAAELAPMGLLRSPAGQGAAAGSPAPAPATRLVAPPFVAAGTSTPEALTKAEVDRRAAELVARSRKAVELGTGRGAGRARFKAADGADAAPPDPGAAATPEEIAARVEAARLFLVNGDPRGSDVPPLRAGGISGAPDVEGSARGSGLPGAPGTKPGT